MTERADTDGSSALILERRPLTVAEVAARWRVSEWTVADMTRRGVLARVPGMRLIRIPAAAVERLDAQMSASVVEREDRKRAAAVVIATCLLGSAYVGPRACQRCGVLVQRGRRKWCSEECSDAWWVNHSWSFARAHAIERAGGSEACCAHCGVLVGFRDAEVNHIVPRRGAGYGRGCHHHQGNLEVLCHECHVRETTLQRRERE